MPLRAILTLEKGHTLMSTAPTGRGHILHSLLPGPVSTIAVSTFVSIVLATQKKWYWALLFAICLRISVILPRLAPSNFDSLVMALLV